jgi:ketosteroid isomerase-like protein
VAELPGPVQQLADIEAIKQLKARYFRFVDTKDWTALRSLFTDDARHYYVDADGTEKFTSNDDYFPMMASMLSNGITTHHGHTPEITLLSDTEAEGIWAMLDYVQCDMPHGRESLMGFGHYFETYRKGDDGSWRISSKRNVRLRVDDAPWTLPEG